MKKMILLAAFSAAGLVSAKSTEAKEKTTETKETTSTKAYFYYPVRVTSSCGYTEFIEMGGSNVSCLEVEIDRMEMECDAPVTGWGYA